jgi:hypothetical protein
MSNYTNNNYPNYNNNNYNSELTEEQTNAIEEFVNNPTDETWNAIPGNSPFDDEFLKFVIIPELYEYDDLRGFKFVLEKYQISPFEAGTREMDSDGEDWWWDITNLFDLACNNNDEETFIYLLHLLEKQGFNIWQYYSPGRGVEIGDGYISECNGYLEKLRKEELKKLKLLTSKLPRNLVTYELSEYTPLRLSQNEKNNIMGIVRPPPPPKQAPPRAPPEEEYYAELREPFLHRIQVNNANKKLQPRKKRIIHKLEIYISYDEDHPRPDYEASVSVTLHGTPSYGDSSRVNRIVYKNDRSILIGLDFEFVQIYEFNGRLYYRGAYSFSETYVFPRFVSLDDIWKAIQPYLNMESRTSVTMVGSQYDKYYIKVFGQEFSDNYTITVFDIQPVLNYITAEEAFKTSKMPRNIVRYVTTGEPGSQSALIVKGMSKYHNILTRKYTSKQRRLKHAQEQRKKAKEAQIIAKVKAYEKKKYTRKRK